MSCDVLTRPVLAAASVLLFIPLPLPFTQNTSRQHGQPESRTTGQYMTPPTNLATPAEHENTPIWACVSCSAPHQLPPPLPLPSTTSTTTLHHPSPLPTTPLTSKHHWHARRHGQDNPNTPTVLPRRRHNYAKKTTTTGRKHSEGDGKGKKGAEYNRRRVQGTPAIFFFLISILITL
jgi:hypothetical protein